MSNEIKWNVDQTTNVTTLIENAMEFKRDQNNPVEIFVYYFPHINGVHIQIFEHGWQPEARPDIDENINLSYSRFKDNNLDEQQRLETKLLWNKIFNCVKYWKKFYEEN